MRRRKRQMRRRKRHRGGRKIRETARSAWSRPTGFMDMRYDDLDGTTVSPRDDDDDIDMYDMYDMYDEGDDVTMAESKFVDASPVDVRSATRRYLTWLEGNQLSMYDVMSDPNMATESSHVVDFVLNVISEMLGSTPDGRSYIVDATDDEIRGVVHDELVERDYIDESMKRLLD